MKSFDVDLNSAAVFEGHIPDKLRLGKRIEYFVWQQLQSHPNINVIAQNIQIQDDNRTLGELDCIFQYSNELIHLEIVYKFYVYDPNHNNGGLDGWIGPNRRDSLLEKLNKLKNHQLPILYHAQTKQQLKTIGLDVNTMSQYVLFKAQLFLPLEFKLSNFNGLNAECINGFYIKFNEIEQFNKSKFYIPRKFDWLVIPHSNVPWISYNKVFHKIEAFMKDNYAPLLWLKHPNGVIDKCFVVWW